MITVEEMFNRAKELVDAAGRKAGDLTDIAKMKLKFSENERGIEATLTALGRVLYDSRCTGEAMPEDTVAELVQQVDELEAANEELQAAMDNTRGRKTCRGCGHANPETAAYCNKCGSNLD